MLLSTDNPPSTRRTVKKAKKYSKGSVLTKKHYDTNYEIDTEKTTNLTLNHQNEISLIFFKC